MEHRFIKFEEAVEKLGISADRLNQLREDGELRAYRDGASWKFRADEIDRLVEEGVPEPAPPSDIGLVDDAELVDASDLAGLPELDDELTLASDDDLSLGSDTKLGAGAAGGSELELADLDDETVTAGASDPRLKDADEPSDPSDSILLSEEELGESTSPPSTIIGKSDLESKDADLELVTDADETDVKLTSGGASEVLSSHVAGSGVLDDLEKESGNTSAFEGLEELELDLAAESGRILGKEEADDFAAEVGVAKGKPQGDSDLTLKDVELAGEDEGTDPIPTALDKGTPKAKKDAGPTSDLELATDDDDDFVLAEAGGSDITLDSADSGINLIDPSDSGLALDDIPLEMGGSAILESLSLGGDKDDDADISLVGDAPVTPAKPRAKLQTDDDFRLTPLGDREEDGDSSSQVIALDAGMEDLAAGDAGILGDDVFAEEPEGVVLTEDYEGEPGAEFGAYAGAVAPRSESEYSMMNILGLGSCMLLLLLGVIVMMDMVRNIWSWDQNLALNDSLLDSLLGLFGLS
jgi:excisionase family DNA binding protein